jgi:ABC-2 type transport system ATP-binding protein
MNSNIIVSLHNVTKRYKTKKNVTTALDKISFNIHQNEIIGYIGNNGAGKTTTIHTILQLLNYDEGEIKYFFNNTLNPVNYISYSPEENSLPDYMTGIDFLKIFYELKTEKKLSDSDLEIFEKHFNISLFVGKKIRNYSKGMKKKLAIANALLVKAKLVILDEPFEGLDPKSQQALVALIKELQERELNTYFVSSHILANLESMCSRIIMVESGKIKMNKLMEEIKEEKISLVNLF